MAIIDWSKIYFVEVKGSLGKFPTIARRHFSRTQQNGPVWDALVRVKVFTPMKGEVHRDDVNNVVLEVVDREQRAIYEVMMTEYAVGHALEMRRHRETRKNQRVMSDVMGLSEDARADDRNR